MFSSLSHEYSKIPNYYTVIFYRVTNGDGRIPNLLTQEQFIPGKYMIRFETEAYFKETGVSSFFYPYVEVIRSKCQCGYRS